MATNDGTLSWMGYNQDNSNTILESSTLVAKSVVSWNGREWNVDVRLSTFEVHESPEENYYFANVYVFPENYHSNQYGLIYSDGDFSQDISYILQGLGCPDRIQFSEAGMQGQRFCHLGFDRFTYASNNPRAIWFLYRQTNFRLGKHVDCLSKERRSSVKKNSK